MIIKIEIPEELKDEAIEHNISKLELSKWLTEATEIMLDDVEATVEDILEWKGDRDV